MDSNVRYKTIQCQNYSDYCIMSGLCISIGYNAGITLTIAPWTGYIPHVESGRETTFRAVQVCLGRSCSGAEKAVNDIGLTGALAFYTHREAATAYSRTMDKAVVATGQTMYKAGQK